MKVKSHMGVCIQNNEQADQLANAAAEPIAEGMHIDRDVAQSCENFNNKFLKSNLASNKETC